MSGASESYTLQLVPKFGLILGLLPHGPMAGGSYAFRSRRDLSLQLLGQDWSGALLLLQPEVAQVFWAGVVQGLIPKLQGPKMFLGPPLRLQGLRPLEGKDITWRLE